MSQINYNELIPAMAPSDPKWHLRYAQAFLEFTQTLDELRDTMGNAEDLGDYVGAIADLLTFRPHTLQDIERDAYEAVYGKDAADSLRRADEAMKGRGE